MPLKKVIDVADAITIIRDGGGLDVAYLGFGECDANGNASRFGSKVPGCGGFINISQRSRKVVFIGTFSSGGLEVKVADGKLAILKAGKHRKFVERVGQITFSGAVASQRGQDVLYLTERCVFRLRDGRLHLTEVAPGVDVERDILAHMAFAPVVDRPKPMDPAIFLPKPMGLRDRMLDIRIEDRISYDAESNTLYLNFAGMRVRSEADIKTILAAVDRALEPLGHRVNSVVNCDRFVCDDDMLPQYMEAVRRDALLPQGVALHGQRVPAPQARQGARQPQAVVTGVRVGDGGAAASYRRREGLEVDAPPAVHRDDLAGHVGRLRD